jgi:hypothetical protein
VDHLQVGPTETTCLDSEEYLSSGGLGDIDLLDR